MTDTQLELSLSGGRVAPTRRSPGHPSTSASSWWFQRMRQIVDRAFDWQPAPEPRPEQTWLPGTHRHLRVNS